MQTIKKHLLGRLLALFTVAFLSTGMAWAQVSVSVSDVAGRPGETVTVPVTLSGVTSVNSFQFTVTTGADLTYAGYDATGTLASGFSLSPASTVSGSSVTVGGFNGGSGAITSNGTLLNLKFTLGANPAIGTLSLANTEFDGVAPAGGGNVGVNYTISNIFIDAADETVRVGDAATITVSAVDAVTNLAAFTVDVTVGAEFGGPVTVAGGTLTSGWGNQFQINALGGNVYRVGGFGTPVSGTGSLFVLSGNAAVIGTANVTFSNLDFTDNLGATIPVAGDAATFTVVANSPPVATAQAVTVAEDGSVTITLAGTDANGDALTFATTSAPANGTLGAVAGADVTYTPNADFNGSDSFTFTANDGLATSAAATVTITVTAVNDAPVASDGTLTTNEDTAGDVTLAATDVDGDALTYTVTTAASNGTVSITGNVATYTPNADYNGADSFGFTASDGTLSDTGTIAVTVTPQNDPPVVANLGINMAEDGAAVTVTLTATDAEGDAVTFAIGTAATNGTASITGDVLTYTPNADYNGADSFTYVANDGTSDSAPGSVSVAISAVNDAPVFTAQMADQTVLEDGFVFFTYTATDVDGDALTFSVVSPASGSIDATTGDFTWDPQGNVGANNIQVAVSDGTETVNSTVAVVTVLPVDALGVNLAGVHEVPPVATPANGTGFIRVVESAGTMDVSVWVNDLSSAFTAAHIHMAGVGQNGGVGVALTAATVSADGRDVTFSETFDLATSVPAGMTVADFITALRGGNAYVNVHTAAYPAGEVRSQILAADNGAPEASSVRAPASVVISGNGDDRLFSVSWLPATDPNGDTINYIWQMATDAAFQDVVAFENYGNGNGFRLTVAEAAAMFDDITNAVPGAVGVGGTITLHHRIITTDGSAWTAGAASTLDLTRGTVTANEGETELPTEFALKGNYPNPFNPTTSVQFDLPESADVTVTVTDMLGRQVMSVETASLSAGANQTVQLNAAGLTSGLYLYRVVARGAGATYSKVGTMTLIK